MNGGGMCDGVAESDDSRRDVREYPDKGYLPMTSEEFFRMSTAELRAAVLPNKRDIDAANETSSTSNGLGAAEIGAEAPIAAYEMVRLQRILQNEAKLSELDFDMAATPLEANRIMLNVKSSAEGPGSHRSEVPERKTILKQRGTAPILSSLQAPETGMLSEDTTSGLDSSSNCLACTSGKHVRHTCSKQSKCGRFKPRHRISDTTSSRSEVTGHGDEIEDSGDAPGPPLEQKYVLNPRVLRRSGGAAARQNRMCVVGCDGRRLCRYLGLRPPRQVGVARLALRRRDHARALAVAENNEHVPRIQAC